MPTLEASGTQTAVINTEHTLATIVTSKTLFPEVDISALAAGEYVEIKVKTKTLSGGVTRISFGGIFSWLDALVNPIVVGDPIISDIEYLVTLKQLNGTGRAFPWKVLSP